MNPKESKYSNWLEVSQKTLDFIRSFIQFIPIISTAVGIIFAYFSRNEWAIVFIGMALLFLGVIFLTRNVFSDRQRMLVNPGLWIERDELKVQVFTNKRTVERRYSFRAKKKAERYRFKLRWSGSENIKVNLAATDDVLIRITSPKVQKSWHRYEVRFQNILRPGEKKDVILHYELPDRANESEPYHLISYSHVAGCSKLIARLSFPDSQIARDVFLIHYDADWEVKRGLPVGFDTDDREYRIEIAPEAGIRYSLEWQEKYTPPPATISTEKTA